MKVYVDVSNLLLVDFITGIQRFVREVLIRMIQNTDFTVILLNCPQGEDKFTVLNNSRFTDYFLNQSVEKKEIFTDLTYVPSDFEAGAVFFDIDSVWLSHYRRSSLLPILKNNGLRLAVYIQDIIPINYPQYCNDNTSFFFTSFIAAYLQYADIILTSTQSTLDKINALAAQLSLPPVKGYVTSLGSDFMVSDTNDETVSRETMDIVKKGKYILCVGTIEARKNHKVLLDAYDKRLAELGINLVFAGRVGWKVEELAQRMEDHPRKDKGFYHLVGQNDATIDYLYRNAWLVAFASYEEGFGLPLIESIERGTIPVSSDIPVLREVGGDFCDYFDPDSPDQFADIVENYLNNPALYTAKKEHLKDYVPVTWDEVTERIVSALKTLKPVKFEITPEVHQMVVLSARPEALLESLPFVEYFMGFITELVICCPDKAVNTIEDKYNGRLKLTFLTDSEVLNGAPLPEDHITRNLYLRCLAMRSPKINDQFIMSDDDYRPLKEVTVSDYIQDDKYLAYYCYDLDKWDGAAWAPTSFDLGLERTADFLKENHYPCKHYASHMPQIINKQVFLELLERHPDISTKGYCEWSTYFNYLQYAYPENVEVLPYRTLCWPGSPTDWKLQVVPRDFLFENFYEESYQEGGIFEGFSTKFTEDITKENTQKINLYTAWINRYLEYQKTFDVFSKIYANEYREMPQIGVYYSDDQFDLVLPQYLIMEKNGMARIPFEIRVMSKTDTTLEIRSQCVDANGLNRWTADPYMVPFKSSSFTFPVFGGSKKGTFLLKIAVSDSHQTVEKEIPLLVI